MVLLLRQYTPFQALALGSGHNNFKFYRQKLIYLSVYFETGNNRSRRPTYIVVLVWWQVYQLQSELQKAQTENEFQKRRSLRCGPHPETLLQEEVRSLRCQLVKAEKLDPVRTMT